MSDAVRAALEAAAEAAMESIGWEDDGMQDFEPRDTCRDAAASAIAAFLRALPDRDLLSTRMDLAIPLHLHGLAAAAEAAAREGE